MNFLHHLFNLCILFSMSVDFNKISQMKRNQIDVPKEVNLSQSELDKIMNLRENIIYNTSTKYKPGDVICPRQRSWIYYWTTP